MVIREPLNNSRPSGPIVNPGSAWSEFIRTNESLYCEILSILQYILPSESVMNNNCVMKSKKHDRLIVKYLILFSY